VEVGLIVAKQSCRHQIDNGRSRPADESGAIRAGAGQVIAFVLVLAATPASAYVGPGAGITMIGALIGVVIAVLGAIGALLFWPARAWLKRRKGNPDGKASSDGTAGSSDTNASSAE